MKILLIVAGLFAIGLVNAYFRKKTICDFGYTLGKNHMKDQWGIDTE